MTNTEIGNIIAKSKRINQEAGITNPDTIYPGQVLTFLFQDGVERSITIEHGDNQWKVLKNKLSLLIETHGSVMPYPDPKPDSVKQDSVPVNPNPGSSKSSWNALPDIWGFIVDIWPLFALIALVLIVYFLILAIRGLIKRFRDMHENPVTAGPPQVHGGVNDANAHSRMQQVAESRFPGARIDIKNIRRGWLSGLAKVFYADGKTKKLRLRDVPSYAGETRINGRDETIYFLQGCGNDARVGNYMMGDLEFRPDVIINTNGSESPIPEENPAVETVAENQPPAVPAVNPSSEHNQRVTETQKMLGELLKGNDAKHKVEMVHVHKNGDQEDRFEVKIESWYDKVSKKLSTPAEEGK